MQISQVTLQDATNSCCSGGGVLPLRLIDPQRILRFVNNIIRSLSFLYGPGVSLKVHNRVLPETSSLSLPNRQHLSIEILHDMASSLPWRV